MTTIAGIREQYKTVFKRLDIFLLNRIYYTVDRRVDHSNRFDFRPVLAEFIDIIQRLFYLMNFKIGKCPVLILPGKPQLGMMQLYAEHKFSKARFICSA